MTTVDQAKLERFAAMVGMDKAHVGTLAIAIENDEFAPDPPVRTDNQFHVRRRGATVTCAVNGIKSVFLNEAALRFAAWLVVSAEETTGQFDQLLEAVRLEDHRENGPPE